MQKVLESIYLEEYYDKFIQNGYDKESDLQFLCEIDLDTIGINKRGHRKRILQLASEMRKSVSIPAKEKKQKPKVQVNKRLILLH